MGCGLLYTYIEYDWYQKRARLLANGHHNLYTVLCERGRQGGGEKTCELTSSANVADTCNVSAALLKSRLTGQKKLAKATARRRPPFVRSFSQLLIIASIAQQAPTSSSVEVIAQQPAIERSRNLSRDSTTTYYILGNASCFSELNMLLQRTVMWIS